nr:MAG TPA_asm: beta-D-galactosidase [Caudoviricetes sp.]
MHRRHDGKAGDLTVTATADGVETAKITITKQ